MRAIVQRVLSAKVEIEGREVGAISVGLCVLAAVHRDDDEAKVRKLADKLVNLRIFSDADGKMNLSLLDLQAAGKPCGVLAVSNFTVYGDASKSRRPSFGESAGYETGKLLFDRFLAFLKESGLPIETGEFGGDMQVSIVNDGPVTVIVEV